MRPAIPVAAMVAACAFACSVVAHANVILESTRVIFPGDARDVTVRLTNQRPGPVLVEAWIEADAPADKEAGVPFAVTPPLLRMEAGKGQALRVHRLPGDVPSDRESVYWLNVLDLPPDPPASEDNRLKVALRTSIKVFHRPAGLPGTARRAPERLAWRVVTEGGASPALRVDNPTPYYVTISRVEFGGDALDLRGGMVAPFARLDIALDGETLQGKPGDAGARARALQARGEVAFRFLNDSGGAERRVATLRVDASAAP